MPTVELLRTLSAVRSPSGGETAATAFLADRLRPLCAEVTVDDWGNVLGFLPCGKPNAPLLLWDAHLDEIGFLTKPEKTGFLPFGATGSTDKRLWAASAVTLLTDPPAAGVVMSIPPHLADAQTPPALMIDAGDVVVPPGTAGVFEGTLRTLAGTRVTAPGLDNRAGIAAILLALDRLTDANADLLISFTVQEEVGSRGITAAMQKRRTAGLPLPRAAAAVDVTYGRTVDEPFTLPLGGGVCVNIGVDCDRRLGRHLFRLCAEHKINHQREVTPGLSRTNATPLQTFGIKTAVLSVPLRYMHTPCEVVDTVDIESTADLLKVWAQEASS